MENVLRCKKCAATLDQRQHEPFNPAESCRGSRLCRLYVQARKKQRKTQTQGAWLEKASEMLSRTCGNGTKVHETGIL